MGTDRGDRRCDCASRGNRAEMCAAFEKTDLYFLFHSQISNVSRDKFGKEKVKYTKAL